MKRLLYYLLLFSLLIFSMPALAEETAPPAQPQPAQPTAEPQAEAKTEFVHELDPYYSQISLHIPLTSQPIAVLTDMNEFQVYRRLFVDSLVPRYMLLEAAVFPMPLLGVAAKHYVPDFYRDFNIGSSNINLIEAITAGFQEPYAFSIFFGDMVSFVKPGEGKVGSNKGYMGYMASYSNQHIKRNVLIPDHNLEVEWKTKGDWIFRDQKQSWSFRVGAKVHDNPEIANSFYLGLRRSNLDYLGNLLSFMHNSTIDFRWDFSARDGRLLRQEYIIGKKFPIKAWHVAFKMDVGLIWEDPARYSGSLRDKDFQNLTAVIRPNIEF